MKISTRTCRQVLTSKHRKCWYWDRPLVNFCSCIKGYTSTIVLKTDKLFLWFWKVLCTDSNAVKTIFVHMDRQKWLTTQKKKTVFSLKSRNCQPSCQRIHPYKTIFGHFCNPKLLAICFCFCVFLFLDEKSFTVHQMADWASTAHKM